MSSLFQRLPSADESGCRGPQQDSLYSVAELGSLYNIPPFGVGQSLRRSRGRVCGYRKMIAGIRTLSRIFRAQGNLSGKCRACIGLHQGHLYKCCAYELVGFCLFTCLFWSANCGSECFSDPFACTLDSFLPIVLSCRNLLGWLLLVLLHLALSCLVVFSWRPALF